MYINSRSVYTYTHIYTYVCVCTYIYIDIEAYVYLSFFEILRNACIFVHEPSAPWMLTSIGASDAAAMAKAAGPPAHRFKGLGFRAYPKGPGT